MKNTLRSTLSGYGLAIACTVLATWLHFLFFPEQGHYTPYITFFPAVFITALLARLGPALLCIALSALAANYWFIPPEHTLLLRGVSEWMGMTLFVLFGVALTVMSEVLHRKSEQVQQDRERFAVTLASIGDGVIVTDREARVTFMNAVAERLTGWSAAEAMDRPLDTVFRIVNELTREATESPVAKALREGRIVGLANHTIVIGKDGVERAIDDSAAPIRQPNGTVVGVVLVFRDVSQQRAAEIVSSRLAALVDGSEDAILGQSLEGIVTDWNVAAERLFGFSAEEVLGRPTAATIVPPDRQREWLAALQRVRHGERVDLIETVRRRKDGRTIPVSVRYSPIRDGEGKVTGVSAIDRDISVQKVLEKRRNARLAVTQVLAREENVDNAISEILAAIGSALEWDAGCFWRYHPDEDVLRCEEFWQQESRSLDDFRAAAMRLELGPGRSLPGRVWQSGQPEWVSDVVNDPGFVRAPQAVDVGLHGGFACPIAVGEQFFGVAEWFSQEIKKPDADLLEMMGTIGGQVGQFIERREAEQKRRRSEEELSDFFENAAVGLHWVGPDGIVQRVNRAELDLLGYAREEYVGRHIAEFHVDRPVIEDILQRLATGETLHDYEARLRCKDDSIKHVLIDSNVLQENGRFAHTRCFTRDITERKQAETRLHESEERLRLALEAGRMGTWEWHIPTGNVIWSPTLEAIHGLAPGSFPGTFEAYQHDIHPDDLPRVVESIRQNVEEGREHHLVYRIVWPDGSVHWLEARGRLLRDASGQPVRLVGVCSDVSERKSLEQQLQRQLDDVANAEAFTSAIIQSAIDGIITIDQQGDVVEFNPAAERIFGYRREEVLGREMAELIIPPHLRDGHREGLARYLGTGEGPVLGQHLEFPALRRDGTSFPVELAITRVSQVGPPRFAGYVRDITERKRMEQSLQFLAEASKSLASLIDYKSTLQRVAHLAVPAFADWCAVDMLAADGTLQRLAVAHIDPTKVQLAEELYERYPPHPQEPRGVRKVLRSGESELEGHITDEMLEMAARDDEHLRIMRELTLCSYMCVPLRTNDKTLGAMTFVAAESGRRYEPQDLSMAEDLAHRAAIAVENARLYQEVRDAGRRKDEFLAMLAHELRNPLAPLRSGLDLLAMDDRSDRETIELMQQQIEHVVRLVDDLLDVSRIMRGKIELRREPVELSALVNRVAAAVGPMMEDNAQQLVVSLPEQPVWLNADPVRLVQVVENLLNNAAKYSDVGSRVDLSAELQNGQVAISVRDTGIGIEPELLPRVFDLFTQSSRSLDRAQGGLGIGLTLVHRLVQMHGGTIAAASNGPGQGSTFTVRLPVVTSTFQVPQAAKVQPTTRRRRILAVDDNVGAARLLSMLLMKLGDHDVETAHDGPAALEKIKALHPELVLLDIGLPGMDGYQVAREVRQDRCFDDVLLVALTGYGQEEDRQRSKEAGFDEHLVKPPSVDQMQEVLAHPKMAN